MAASRVAGLLAARRRRRSLALAVRLFECGSEPEMARAILTLGAAALFERYLAGELGPAAADPASPIDAVPSQAGDRIVPFARPAPAEGA